MRYPTWALTLSLLVVGCSTPDGNIVDTGDSGVVDSGDSGVDSGDSGVVDTCGDAVVDDGEDCDLGTDNNDDGSCATDCTWVDWLACEDVPGVIDLAATAQPDGSFHIHGQFFEDLRLETSCLDDAVNQAAVAFTLPTAGDWVVTTDNPGTGTATAVSLRNDCDLRAEIDCAVGNGIRPGTASLLLQGAAAGEQLVVVVEQLDDSAAGWHLSFAPVTGLADAGEACDADNWCAFDSTCTGGTCVAVTAPTVDAIAFEAVNYKWNHVVTGTDPNRDVVTLQVTRTEDIDGNVYGDDPSDEPIVYVDAHPTWDGDTYTFVLQTPEKTEAYKDRVSVDFDQRAQVLCHQFPFIRFRGVFDATPQIFDSHNPLCLSIFR